MRVLLILILFIISGCKEYNQVWLECSAGLVWEVCIREQGDWGCSVKPNYKTKEECTEAAKISGGTSICMDASAKCQAWEEFRK